MADANDMDLVREFAGQNTEAAFAELVQRHVNLVYSVALRFTGESADAQDVTQAVFIILARKAASLHPNTVLTGWLYETTRFTATRFLRASARRRAYEQEASVQSKLEHSSDENTWLQLASHLEMAMSRLGAADRALLALRFYENRTGAETAALLGIHEEAARKRTSRALEKLRKFFLLRGVSSTTAIIAGTISTHSVQAAPAALATLVTSAAMAKGATASASTLTLVKGTLNIMAWSKAQTTVVGVGILLIAGTGALIVKDNFFFPTEPNYQGRRLSEWLADVDYGQPQKKRDAAAKAIRNMGTKTLPFLLADLGDKHFSRVHYAQPDNRTPDERNSQATWAFDALGPMGKPAIPDLVTLLHQNPGYIPSALAGIGPDAVPELLSALTNDDFWVRDNTAAALANALDERKITPAQAQAAFPIALANMTYTSTDSFSGLSFQVNTCFRAADLLGALHLNPDQSVPALIEGMNSPVASLAAECAASLSNFGKDAAPAVPNLIQGLNSSNSLIAMQCAMTLGNAELANDAADAIPSLIQGLGNTNSSVVFMCASSLGNYSSKELGTNRMAAIFALSDMVNSTNPQLSQIARQSLRFIEKRR